MDHNQVVKVRLTDLVVAFAHQWVNGHILRAVDDALGRSEACEFARPMKDEESAKRYYTQIALALAAKRPRNDGTISLKFAQPKTTNSERIPKNPKIRKATKPLSD